MKSNYIRKQLIRHLAKTDGVELSKVVPDYETLNKKLSTISETGLYLHIPFCNRICPYCPYNKEVYTEEKASGYIKSILTEIDIYASMLGDVPITSFYIGGGTPTTLIGAGLEEILNHVYKRFNMQCGIHIESHPTHLSHYNLDHLKELGVKYLSVGIEALQDHHLSALKRNYTVADARKSISRAMEKGFECVNMDFMFDLPGQTEKEIEEASEEMVNWGVHQVATYPLFNFDYTKMGKSYQQKRGAVSTMFRRRRLLKILEDTFYNNDFYRSSVWAFTKKGVDKYCSVTVPGYIGLGPSGSSYLDDVFYVNTFKVRDYVKAFEKGKLPIALSVDLSKEMQMVSWMYWRIYETKFQKSAFFNRFGQSLDEKYGQYLTALKILGYLKEDKDNVSLTDKGAYWIHAFEDYFSINYINKLWGTLRKDAWPDKVVL